MNKKYLYLIIGVAAVVAIAVAGLVGCQDRGTDMPAEVVQTAQPPLTGTAIGDFLLLGYPSQQKPDKSKGLTRQ